MSEAEQSDPPNPHAVLYRALHGYWFQAKVMLGWIHDKVQRPDYMEAENGVAGILAAFHKAWQNHYKCVEAAIQTTARFIDDDRAPAVDRWTVRLHAALVRSLAPFAHVPPEPRRAKIEMLMILSNGREQIAKFQRTLDEIESFLAVLHVLKSEKTDPADLSGPSSGPQIPSTAMKILRIVGSSKQAMTLDDLAGHAGLPTRRETVRIHVNEHLIPSGLLERKTKRAGLIITEAGRKFLQR
jgi:hypothetical protein